MIVRILAHTPEPEKLVAMAAKLCYSDSSIDDLSESLTPDRVERFIEMLADLGHGSPLEHVSFTFGIEGVSRALLAQITRHRIASFSVQSQRYVSMGAMNRVIPPEIAAIPEAAREFEDAMKDDLRHYDSLRSKLIEKHYQDNLDAGMDKKKAYTAAEKKANEDARFVLPNACDTKMMVTMNARELMNFFSLRCCNRAQWEIRELADEMLRQVRKICPNLFYLAGPACVRGKCPEGAMSCGHPRKKINEE